MKRQAGALGSQWLVVAAGVTAVWVATRNRLPGPSIRHPGQMGAWWRSEGPIVAVFSTARGVLLLAGCYWLALLTLAILGAAGGPGRRALRQLSRCRLPGARLAVSWTAGLSAAGSVLLTGGAAGAVAAPAMQPPQPPELVNLTPAGTGAAGQAAAGRDQPPVLRYLGPSDAERPGHGAPSQAVGSSPEAGAEPDTSTTTPARPAGGAPSPPPATSATTGPPPTTATPPATRPAHPIQPKSPPLTPNRAPAARPTPLPSPAYAPPANPSPANPSPAIPPPANPSPANPPPANPGPPPDTIDRRPPRYHPNTRLRPVPTDDRPRPQPLAQWTVKPGDDFWSISERTLSAAWGRLPTDREIGPYWLAVIAANQDSLPDPGNPNLLFPGEVVVLPSPPQATPDEIR